MDARWRCVAEIGASLAQRRQEGKNIGVVMPDADLDEAAAHVTLGATSYNGQRCTAIKLTLVHESVKDAFLEKLVAKVTPRMSTYMSTLLRLS